MSTTTQALKYRWTAYFEDGKVMEQPEDDRYSKHDDTAEYNPSSFRDLLEYEEKSKLIYFDINDGTFAYGVDMPSGRFGINGTWFSLETDESLAKRKLIYWRGVQKDDKLHANGEVAEGEPYVYAYFFGYTGINSKGERVQKVVRID